ncbi:MAG: hypothetical protein IPI93_14340 [Sphingobacteriaceae bacterium]|nr:hypothetical protein [Sphingobacteriaceae bacterium]
MKKVDEMDSLLNDLSELLDKEFSSELKLVIVFNNKLQNFRANPFRHQSYSEHTELIYLANLMLKIIMIEKFKLNYCEYDRETFGRIQNILQDDLHVALGKLTIAEKNGSILGLDKVLRPLWNDDSKVIALNNALKFLNSNIAVIQKDCENHAANIGKFLNDFEVIYNKTKRKLTEFNGKLIVISRDISTIYENLESLINDHDKSKEKETCNLLYKYRKILVVLVLNKDKTFIRDFEDARNDFGITYQAYVDDEGLGLGGTLSEAIGKIEAVL